MKLVFVALAVFINFTYAQTGGTLTATPTCLQLRQPTDTPASAISAAFASASAVANACDSTKQRKAIVGNVLVSYTGMGSYFFNISQVVKVGTGPLPLPQGQLCSRAYNIIVQSCISDSAPLFFGGWLVAGGLNYSVTNFAWPLNPKLAASSSVATTGISTSQRAYKPMSTALYANSTSNSASSSVQAGPTAGRSSSLAQSSSAGQSQATAPTRIPLGTGPSKPGTLPSFRSTSSNSASSSSAGSVVGGRQTTASSSSRSRIVGTGNKTGSNSTGLVGFPGKSSVQNSIRSTTSTATSSSGTSTTGSSSAAVTGWLMPSEPTTSMVFGGIPATPVSPSSAAQTSDGAILAGLLIGLYRNKPKITDPVLKSEYIDDITKTRLEFVNLLDDLGQKNFPLKNACSDSSSKKRFIMPGARKRSLLSSITSLATNFVKSIACTINQLDDLATKVKIPQPVLNEIEPVLQNLETLAADIQGKGPQNNKPSDNPSGPSGSASKPSNSKSTASSTTSRSSSSSPSSSSGSSSSSSSTQSSYPTETPIIEEDQVVPDSVNQAMAQIVMSKIAAEGILSGIGSMTASGSLPGSLTAPKPTRSTVSATTISSTISASVSTSGGVIPTITSSPSSKLASTTSASPQCMSDSANWLAPSVFCDCGASLTYPTLPPTSSGTSTVNCHYTSLNPASAIKPTSISARPSNIGVSPCVMYIAADQGYPSYIDNYCFCPQGILAPMITHTVSSTPTSDCNYSPFPTAAGWKPTTKAGYKPASSAGPSSSSSPPPPPPYATGKCSVHVWQGLGDPQAAHEVVYLSVNITDAKGVPIGANHIATTWAVGLGVDSLLPYVLVVTPIYGLKRKRDESDLELRSPQASAAAVKMVAPPPPRPLPEKGPVQFAIGAQSWDTNSPNCANTVGAYNNGNAADFFGALFFGDVFIPNRQMDCRFDC